MALTQEKNQTYQQFHRLQLSGSSIKLLEENCNLLPYSAHFLAIEVFGRFLDKRMVIVKALL